MGLIRAILCVVLPPLAVIDKGCGSFLLVLLLTVFGFWVAGVVAALLICLLNNQKYIYVCQVPGRRSDSRRGGDQDAIDVDAREL